MIREANETDILNLRVLCTQVWLHSYALKSQILF